LVKKTFKPAACATPHFDRSKVAVLVPCYNEETAIAKVVPDFRAALPQASIFVYDKNSTDRTAAVARAAGAEVFEEKHHGKGSVVQRMFTDVEADIYLLAVPIFITYFETDRVPRLPTAVLSTGLIILVILAFLSTAVGLILDTGTRGRREPKLFAYLSQRARGEERRCGRT
jgi:glycosyltransferase involved in cell wall biosynthesis